jgi:hypothetical protein
MLWSKPSATMTWAFLDHVGHCQRIWFGCKPMKNLVALLVCSPCKPKATVRAGPATMTKETWSLSLSLVANVVQTTWYSKSRTAACVTLIFTRSRMTGATPSSQWSLAMSSWASLLMLVKRYPSSRWATWQPSAVWSTPVALATTATATRSSTAQKGSWELTTASVSPFSFPFLVVRGSKQSVALHVLALPAKCLKREAARIYGCRSRRSLAWILCTCEHGTTRICQREHACYAALSGSCLGWLMR